MQTGQNYRPRCREVGIAIGADAVGPNNAITDVAGVRVGHVTLVQGEGPLRIGAGPVRTGVTAILPPGDDWWERPVEAGQFTFNGSGTTAGLSCIDEYHRIETPICLTNTLSVGSAYEGIVRYMVDEVFRRRGEVPWFNPVVGETSDAFLNDIGGLHVRPAHAVEAIEKARGGPVPEGSVGGGTGMSTLGWKGGIGTSSRTLRLGRDDLTIGVLVQSNFGGRLTIGGVDMGALERPQDEQRYGGSIMIVVATDAPLDGHQLERLGRRATFGLARAGSSGGHGSGDYAIAFSTTWRRPDEKKTARQALAIKPGRLDRLFQASADATEEAILNALFRATTVVGRDGNTREALPLDPVLARVRTA